MDLVPERIARGRERLARWLERTLEPGGAGVLVLATLVGSLSGLLSVVFWWAIHRIDTLDRGTVVPWIASTLGSPFGHPELYLTLFPAIGALLMAVLTLKVFHVPHRLGVPGVMFDARTSPGSVPLRIVVVTFIASALIIGFGGSAGREAPVVAMGGILGGWVGRKLGLYSRRRQILIGCGTSAAIAAAFNAPLAGVFFALEVVLEDYSAATLSPVVLASVAGTAVARALEDPALSHFQVPPYHLGAWWEIGLYAGVGLAAGLVAPLFVRVEQEIQRRISRSRVPALLRPALGGLGVGVIALVLPQVMGNGYEHVQSALAAPTSAQILLALVFAKLVATSLTLGSGGWGGDFAPLLFMGAMLGGAYGRGLDAIFPSLGLSPGAYAMVGMGAMLTAAVRCPITAILLLFELTGSYQVILPIMAACAVATPVARILLKRGMYHSRLEEMGGPAGELPETRLLAAVPVGDIIRRDVVTLAASTPYRKILRVIATSDQLVFPVLDADRRLLGALTFADLRGHLDAAELAELVVAADATSPDVPTLHESETLDKAMHVFASSDLEEIPVVADGDDPAFVGVLTRRQAFAARERALAEWEMEGL